MNHTLNIFDCQYAVKFVPISSLIRSKRYIHFFSRVSRYGQDHRKYIAALKIAYNRLRLPMPFTMHKRTECGQLGKNTKYFTWLAQEIPNTEDVVCVFPALDRLFRPIGFDQYQESDFELFRQQLEVAGRNPDKITFALLNDGTLELDRTFETRLGDNYKTMHKTGRIDPKASKLRYEEVRKLRTLGMSVPDICFHLAVRLEQVADRTIRDWVQEMRISSNWDNMQHEARALAFFEGKNATEIHRRFTLRGKAVSLRAVQYWVQGVAGFASEYRNPEAS